MLKFSAGFLTFPIVVLLYAIGKQAVESSRKEEQERQNNVVIHINGSESAVGAPWRR